MNEKEKWIIEALHSISCNIDYSGDHGDVLGIQIEALIKYIKTDDDEQWEIATDWDKAWKVYEK